MCIMSHAWGHVLQTLPQALTTRDGEIIGVGGEVIDLKGITWFGAGALLSLID